MTKEVAKREGGERWFHRLYVRFTLMVLILALVLIVLWATIVIPIYPGHRGVYWSRFFGGTRDFIIGEGTFLKLPWDKIERYNVRVQHLSDQLRLLARNGLAIDATWSVRFYPVRDALPRLHREIGPDYAAKIVQPEVESAFRRVLGNYTPDEIYAFDEQALLAELTDLIREQLHEHPIVFHDVLILRLDLPPVLKDAIEDKLVEEQKMLAYEYIVKAEEREKERRRIEGEGIQLFQAISGISILQWRGIEATLKLAKSSNAKVVVIGPGGDGLPVILNAEPAMRPGTGDGKSDGEGGPDDGEGSEDGGESGEDGSGNGD